MQSVTLITYFYPNTTGWRRSLGSHEVITEHVPPVTFKIKGPKHIGVTTSTCQGHVTFPVTWLFDSPSAISYKCSIVTESLSPAIFGIMGPKLIGITTLTFLGHVTSSVMWPFESHWVISYWWSIDPSLYLQTFSRYWALSILGSRPWPFWVTWRHRSRDHSNPNGSFPIGGPSDPSLYL